MVPFPRIPSRPIGPTSCPRCLEPFLTPADCLPLDDGYLVALVCANCDHEELAVLADERVEEIDGELVRAEQELQAQLEHLERTASLERIERFATALAGDHLLPEDF